MKKIVSVVMSLLLIALTSVSVFAANFTPSVTQKESPEILPIYEDGEEYYAIIRDEKNQFIVGLDKQEIIVTPYSEADTCTQDVEDALTDAYDELYSSDSISDVVPGFDEQVNKVAPGTDPEDYVVKDLFSVSLDGEYVEYINDDNSVTIRYQTGVAPSEPLVVMYYLDGEWQIIDASCYTRNPDGSITITLKRLGVIAFVVQNTGVDGKGPKSPYTYDYTPWVVVFGAALAVAGAVVVVAVKKRETL